jgi:hypothetical protein
MRAWIVLVVVLVAARAQAQDPDEPDPDDEPVKKARGSEVTFAFAGGALVPQGSMEEQTQAGLDVWGRIGWATSSGLGLAVHLEYAPLRRDLEGAPRNEVVDAHLFAATAGPRFQIGRNLVRVWVAGSAGVVVERVATTIASAPTVVEVESSLGVSGGGGLDLNLFGSGGLTLAGAYTQGISTGASQKYVSLNAGVMFVY